LQKKTPPTWDLRRSKKGIRERKVIGIIAGKAQDRRKRKKKEKGSSGGNLQMEE